MNMEPGESQRSTINSKSMMNMEPGESSCVTQTNDTYKKDI